ncbi:MAG: ATP-grasp domain-containing protein [Candidatus Omnitrophica bacterium]|nr:ATP-grasp domain-containing protein [Candidatus Omnitrophota bacterium]
MKIGVTYDLRDDYLAAGYSEEETAEFDRLSTIDAIDGALRELGLITDRIGNLHALVQRLARGDRWNLVFNIAEGLRGIGRESQVPALLDAYGIPYTFSDPLVTALTLHKGLCKQVVRALGVPTPDFFVAENEAQLREITLPGPLFLKPVAEGTGKGITPQSKVRNRDELLNVGRELLARFNQPVLVETFLPGREFTVGILGTGPEARAVGVMEIHLNAQAESDVYSYVNKEYCEERVEYTPADDPVAREAARIALQAWTGLGCRDAGRVDLRADAAGMPQFMEVNPLAGLHPEHSDLPILCRFAGISYRELIGHIVQSAWKRVLNSHWAGRLETWGEMHTDSCPVT